MLKIDLTGKRAFVAGVADDGGFGFAIAKAMAEAGATICLGTWPPAMGIFQNLLERGKMEESLKLEGGAKLKGRFTLGHDTLADAGGPRTSATKNEHSVSGHRRRNGEGLRRSTFWSTVWPTVPR